MALEACPCGFEALPSDLVRTGVQYGKGVVQERVKAGVEAGKAQLRETIRKETGLPTSKKELVRLGASEAQKLKEKAFKEMGIPDIPIKFPSELTAEGVKDAAYAAGKTYVEEAFKAKTGLPIKLPKKLSVKELEKTIGSVIPTNAVEALNLGLTVAAQAAASALTAVLAGTAIGSAIPGLGTIVGLGVGLAIVGIKSLFGKGPTHPEGRACKSYSELVCPQPPTGVNAFQLYTWASQRMKPVWDALRIEQQKKLCGMGAAINCVRGLSEMRNVAFGMSMGAVGQMGIPALDTALAEVLKAPDIESRPTAGSLFGQGAVVYVTGFRGRQPVSAELRPIYQTKEKLIAAIRERKAKLQALVAEANRIEQVPARGNVAPELRFKLVTELVNAGVQVQNAPSKDAISWFKTMNDLYTRLQKRQDEANREMAGRAKKHAEIAAKKSPEEARQAEIRTLRAVCSGGHQPSCERLKQLEAQGPLPTVAPKRAPAPARPPARAPARPPARAPARPPTRAPVPAAPPPTFAPLPGQPGLVRRERRRGFDVAAFRREAEQALQKARAEFQSRARAPEADTSLITSVLNVQPTIVFPSGSLSASLMPYLRGL